MRVAQYVLGRRALPALPSLLSLWTDIVQIMASVAWMFCRLMPRDSTLQSLPGLLALSPIIELVFYSLSTIKEDFGRHILSKT